MPDRGHTRAAATRQRLSRCPLFPRFRAPRTHVDGNRSKGSDASARQRDMVTRLSHRVIAPEPPPRSPRTCSVAALACSSSKAKTRRACPPGAEARKPSALRARRAAMRAAQRMNRKRSSHGSDTLQTSQTQPFPSSRLHADTFRERSDQKTEERRSRPQSPVGASAAGQRGSPAEKGDVDAGKKKADERHEAAEARPARGSSSYALGVEHPRVARCDLWAREDALGGRHLQAHALLLRGVPQQATLRCVHLPHVPPKQYALSLGKNPPAFGGSFSRSVNAVRRNAAKEPAS